MPSNIEGIIIFKADSGITLYSKTKTNIQEDLFSAFLTAIKGLFSSLEIGGLSTFSSDNYIVYLTSFNNVLTSIIVDVANKSEKYFKLAYEICVQFYNEFKVLINDKNSFVDPNKEKFDKIVELILKEFDIKYEIPNEIFQLFEINKMTGKLESIEFIDEEQLLNKEMLVVINLVVKKIFIIENPSHTISSRLLYFATNAVTSLNQGEFKSEFSIQQVSDPWDFERIIKQISNVINKESISI